MIKTSASTFAPGVASQRTIHATTPIVTPMQSHSRLEYIPYEKKIVEYEQRRSIDYVPVQRVIVEYVPQERIDTVPVERIITDYYTVEHITEYIPELIPERKVEYVPVEWIENRVEYRPIERQVVHYPQEYLPVINSAPVNYVTPGLTRTHWENTQVNRSFSPVQVEYESSRRNRSPERKSPLNANYSTCSSKYGSTRDRPKYSVHHSSTNAPIYEGRRLPDRSK